VLTKEAVSFQRLPSAGFHKESPGALAEHAPCADAFALLRELRGHPLQENAHPSHDLPVLIRIEGPVCIYDLLSLEQLGMLANLPQMLSQSRLIHDLKIQSKTMGLYP
jgi:hypothetical protein